LTTADDATDSANSSENSGRIKAQLVLLAGPRPVSPRTLLLSALIVGCCNWLFWVSSAQNIVL
jgi:hypothetical protein